MPPGARGPNSPLGGAYSRHQAPSTRRQFPQAIRVELGFGEPDAAEDVQKSRHPPNAAERGGNRGSVEVRPERDMLDPDPVGHVAGVLGDQLDRRVGIVGEVLAQERAGEHDSHHAA